LRPTEPRIDTAAWDPLCAVACELRTEFLDPLQTKLAEALSVLGDLSGRPIADAGGLAVDAFAFVLIDVALREVELWEDRREKLLQLMAAQIYYRQPTPAIRNRAVFWGFLAELSAKYRFYQGPPGDPLELSAIVDQFLNRYGLAGEENADVVAGIQRIARPLVERVREVLRSRSHLLSV
jgi:hypothetical protein